MCKSCVKRPLFSFCASTMRRQISARQVKLIAVGVEEKVCRIFCCSRLCMQTNGTTKRFKALFLSFRCSTVQLPIQLTFCKRFKEFFCLPLNFCKLHFKSFSGKWLKEFGEFEGKVCGKKSANNNAINSLKIMYSVRNLLKLVLHKFLYIEICGWLHHILC